MQSLMLGILEWKRTLRFGILKMSLEAFIWFRTLKLTPTPELGNLKFTQILQLWASESDSSSIA